MHPLRASGGGLCLAAIVVAAVTARCWYPEASGRTRFISEILAICRRGRNRVRPAAWWGSLVATGLLVVGALLFLGEVTQQAGLDAGASVATSSTLVAVALFPLQMADAATTRRGYDFVHPFAAALFYLAASSLSTVGFGQDAGPIGRALAIVHVVTSFALINLAVLTSFWQFKFWRGLWPFPGTRILLDVRPAGETRAEWVRWAQWPATVAVGVALGVGALGC